MNQKTEMYWNRPIPTAHWVGVSLFTFLLVCFFLVGWEILWRTKGYEPSYEETADLWAFQRDRVTANPDAEVLIGSSRIMFDFDLDMWEQDIPGKRPIMLARVGSCPLPVLTDLANDPEFKGTVICGFTPPLFFLPPPIPPVREMQAFVDHAKVWTLSDKANFYLSIPFENGFASINKEDLSLVQLLQRGLSPFAKNRPSPFIAPQLPPYFGRIDFERRYHMSRRMEIDPDFQSVVQQRWMPLIQMLPALGGPPLDGLLAQVKAEVEAIRKKGGKVIFVRCPSTGELRNLENERWPREQFWDRLLEVTQSPGVHFEDYPQLSNFNCPEWSHLTRADAVRFTHELSQILEPML